MTKRDQALFAAVIITVIFLSAALLVNPKLGQSLVDRPFNAQPGNRGVAQISPIPPATIQSGPDWTGAGSETSLDLSLK